jgi:hypothetical protein
MLQSARKMADWLLSIQFEDGGFQGGLVNALPKVPVTFNTGQILFGLASAAEEFGEPYLTAMKSAAQWLVDTQDADGCWRRHPAPFASSGEKAYETHVAWGLFEAERVQPGLGYADAAIANVRWALSHQHENGWMNRCCLSDDSQPLTHTLGYCLRGLLEANRFRPDAQIFDGAHKLAQGLLSGRRSDGQLPGCFDSNWQGTVDWICLTGNVQVAHCFLMLSRETGDKAFAHAGMELNQFVRRTVNLEGEPGRRGGVKGSFPFSGGYGQYQFLNWAAKFFVDSNLLEAELKTES